MLAHPVVGQHAPDVLVLEGAAVLAGSPVEGMWSVPANATAGAQRAFMPNDVNDGRGPHAAYLGTRPWHLEPGRLQCRQPVVRSVTTPTKAASCAHSGQSWIRVLVNFQ